MEKIFASMLMPERMNARERLTCDPTERILKHYDVKSKIKELFISFSSPLKASMHGCPSVPKFEVCIMTR